MHFLFKYLNNHALSGYTISYCACTQCPVHQVGMQTETRVLFIHKHFLFVYIINIAPMKPDSAATDSIAPALSAPLEVCVGLVVTVLLGLEIVGNGSVFPFESVGAITVSVLVSVLVSVTEVAVGMLLSLTESVGSVRVAAVSEGKEDVATRDEIVVPMPSHTCTYSERENMSG